MSERAAEWERAVVLWLHAVPLDLSPDGVEPEWLDAVFHMLLSSVRVEVVEGEVSVDATQLVMSAWTALTVAVHVGAGRAELPVPEFVDMLVESRPGGVGAIG